MSSVKNVGESFRDVVQDLLVPELKAVKVSVDSLHSEMSYLRSEMKGSLDALPTEMRLRDEKIEQLIRSGTRGMSKPGVLWRRSWTIRL